MLKPEQLNNKFIHEWLDYCGGSESPFLFNLWSGISTAASCLGRRNYVEIGRFSYVPNMYVFLIGPAAVRKSSAGSIGQKLLKKYTDLKFGPTDTAGKKQGLLSSFVNAYKEYEEGDEEEAKVKADPKTRKQRAAGLDSSIFDSTPSGAGDNVVTTDMFAKRRETAKAKAKFKGKKPPHELYVFADELTDFIGVNQIEMVGCLTSLYYPQDKYEYSLSKTTAAIHKPCLNLLGCTTPTALAQHLPPASIGQGFTSRAIMVYQGRAGKKIYPAPPLDPELEKEIGAKFLELSTWEEQFTVAEDAHKMFEKLYMEFKPSINDSRFLHYEQRRSDHLTKVAMVLAACENRTVIKGIDVIDAHLILVATEEHMPHALGEVGMDRLTIAKQSMKEMIEASWPVGITVSALRSNMLRDMQDRDFQATLNEYINKELCIKDTKQITTNGKTIEVQVVIPALPEKEADAFASKGKRDKISKSVDMLEVLLLDDDNSVVKF